MSLKQRLLVFVAALLVAAVGLLSGVSYWQMRNEIVVGVNKELDTAIRGNREALARWLAQRRDHGNGQCPFARAAADPALDPWQRVGEI